MLGFSSLEVCCVLFTEYFFSRSKYNVYPVWQKTKYRMGSNLYFKGFFLLKILELGELMVEKPKN